MNETLKPAHSGVTKSEAAEPAQAPVFRPAPKPMPPKSMPKEIGGPKGPEPTRYGDWERNGRCTDF